MNDDGLFVVVGYYNDGMMDKNFSNEENEKLKNIYWDFHTKIEKYFEDFERSELINFYSTYPF